jgi:hypothetical protein
MRRQSTEIVTIDAVPSADAKRKQACGASGNGFWARIPETVRAVLVEFVVPIAGNLVPQGLFAEHLRSPVVPPTVLIAPAEINGVVRDDRVRTIRHIGALRERTGPNWRSRSATSPSGVASKISTSRTPSGTRAAESLRGYRHAAPVDADGAARVGPP